MARIQEQLTRHIIVCGFGTSGSEAVNELIARNVDPSEIVVIEKDDASLALAESLGCNVLKGDATRDRTLEDVRVARARAVIISAGRDDTSILITLTTRHLAPDVPISTVVRATDNELLARQAGATNVINPASFAGLLLAGSSEGQYISQYLADLASADGRVQLSQRLVTPQEVGLSLADIATGLGVRIYRGGEPFGFWDTEAAHLLAGDVVVEIVPGGGRSRVQ